VVFWRYNEDNNGRNILEMWSADEEEEICCMENIRKIV
jgi:hypothetical protein